MLSKIPLTVGKLRAILDDSELENAGIYLSDMRPLTRVWIVQSEPEGELMVVLSDPEAR